MSDKSTITAWLRSQVLPASLAELRERLLFTFPLPTPGGTEYEARRLLGILDGVIAGLSAAGELRIQGDRSSPVTKIIDRQQ